MKTRALVLFLSVIGTFALLAPALPQADSSPPGPLQQLQWKKRPLLLFAKSRSDARLTQQINLLRDYRPQLEERDMVVLLTAGTEETRSAIGYTPIRSGTARQLRQYYQPAERGMTVVLIGKDGAEKQRWNRLVQPEELIDIIDAMPMRQQEAKKDGVTN